LILDVAAAVKRLRQAGCEKVVLLGMSGGSSVAPFYQRQARTASPGRLTDTPAYSSLNWGDTGIIGDLACPNQLKSLNILATVPAERRH
jgi:hypothetical protein